MPSSIAFFLYWPKYSCVLSHFKSLFCNILVTAYTMILSYFLKSHHSIMWVVHSLKRWARKYSYFVAYASKILEVSLSALQIAVIQVCPIYKSKNASTYPIKVLTSIFMVLAYVRASFVSFIFLSWVSHDGWLSSFSKRHFKFTSNQ